MHLIGWSNPLHDYTVNAIKRGELVVFFDPKTKCEFLAGQTVNPHSGILLVWKITKEEAKCLKL